MLYNMGMPTFSLFTKMKTALEEGNYKNVVKNAQIIMVWTDWQ